MPKTKIPSLVPQAKLVGELLELGGFSYPRRTLVRRISLLTPDKAERCHGLLEEIDTKIQGIDELLSLQAHQSDDPWP